MERHEAEDIARGRIWHVNALLRCDPLRCNSASDGVEKTLLNELLQPLLGSGHGIDGDGATTTTVFLAFSSLSPLTLVFLVQDHSSGTGEARANDKIRRHSAWRVFI
jgi:hypothetical protein